MDDERSHTLCHLVPQKRGRHPKANLHWAQLPLPWHNRTDPPMACMSANHTLQGWSAWACNSNIFSVFIYLNYKVCFFDWDWLHESAHHRKNSRLNCRLPRAMLLGRRCGYLQEHYKSGSQTQTSASPLHFTSPPHVLLFFGFTSYLLYLAVPRYTQLTSCYSLHSLSFGVQWRS
jgi:hypothetical protein